MKKFWIKLWHTLPHPVRWLTVAVVGSSLLLLGLLFLFLPGPGLPLIIVGLAILASEFTWAEILLRKAKHQSQQTLKRLRRKN
jgi:uncharacterized protein (TIGR02611 family)